MVETRLKIYSLHGDKTEMCVPASAHIQTLRQRIAQWQDTSTDNVFVMLKGHALDEDLTLEAEGVRNEATLIVAIKGKHLPKPANMQRTAEKDRPLPAHLPAKQPRPPGPKPQVPSGLKPAVLKNPKPPAVRPSGVVETPAVSDNDVSRLVEMGYIEEEAKSALQKLSGNLEAAVRLLSGEISEDNIWFRIRADIIKDPTTLSFHMKRLMQIPHIREIEVQTPGELRKTLIHGLDIPPAAIDPAAVAKIRGMGFTEQKAREVLAAADGDEELALDILLN